LLAPRKYSIKLFGLCGNWADNTFFDASGVHRLQERAELAVMRWNNITALAAKVSHRPFSKIIGKSMCMKVNYA
jgi:hypothetical protein